MNISVGHFRVAKTSLLKRGQVQNLSCENEFYLYDNKKIIFTRKVLDLASFKNRGLRHLGNGLLTTLPIGLMHDDVISLKSVDHQASFTRNFSRSFATFLFFFNELILWYLGALGVRTSPYFESQAWG